MSWLRYLARMCRAKCSILVDENKTAILNVYYHIYLAVSVHIFEAKGNWREILSRSDQRRSYIDFSLRGIPSRKLNNLYMAVQVQGNKMTWRHSRIVVLNNCVCLKGTWT